MALHFPGAVIPACLSRMLSGFKQGKDSGRAGNDFRHQLLLVPCEMRTRYTIG